MLRQPRHGGLVITTDSIIRQALRARLEDTLHSVQESFIVEELSVANGDARVDLAVVDEWVHGYEIKSDRDTLDRLPDQIRLFSQALDTVTLVVGWRHVVAAMRMVPPWWGVQLAEMTEDRAVRLVELRQPSRNPCPDPVALASFLWRDEALAVLQARGADQGVRSKPRSAVYRRVAATVPLDELRDAVVERFKSREDWRSAERLR